jgi:spore germination protein YaaH
MLLSRHPHLRGVYAWQMGQEDPRAWDELARLLHTRTPSHD